MLRHVWWVLGLEYAHCPILRTLRCAALSRARARHAERVPEARGKPTSNSRSTPEYSHRYLYDEADEPVSGRMQTSSIDPFDAMVCEYEESRNSSASMNVRPARPVQQPSESAPFACARFAQQGRRLARALAEGRLASTPVWLCSALLYAFIRPFANGVTAAGRVGQERNSGSLMESDDPIAPKAADQQMSNASSLASCSSSGAAGSQVELPEHARSLRTWRFLPSRFDAVGRLFGESALRDSRCGLCAPRTC